MKPAFIIIAFLLGIALGAFVGAMFAKEQARVAIIAGPNSDNYGPARREIATAIEKLRSGDTNIVQHLMAADEQIRQAQQWTERFLGGTNEQK
jgi:cellobiose-specific phosphotransferase system component IIA